MNIEQEKHKDIIIKFLAAIESNNRWEFTSRFNYKYRGKGDRYEDGSAVNIQAAIAIIDTITVFPNTIEGSINGFTLPEGKQWHRDDFTEEDLEGEYRPLMLGEQTYEDDEWFKQGKSWKGWTLLSKGHCAAPVRNDFAKHRTTRPILPDGYTPHDLSDKMPIEPHNIIVNYITNADQTGKAEVRDIWWDRTIGYKINDPNYECKVAFADGKDILWKCQDSDVWRISNNSGSGLAFMSNATYKVYPQIPADFVKHDLTQKSPVLECVDVITIDVDGVSSESPLRAEDVNWRQTVAYKIEDKNYECKLAFEAGKTIEYWFNYKPSDVEEFSKDKVKLDVGWYKECSYRIKQYPKKPLTRYDIPDHAVLIDTKGNFFDVLSITDYGVVVDGGYYITYQALMEDGYKISKWEPCYKDDSRDPATT